MRRSTVVLILYVILIFCNSCSDRDDASVKERLSKWDTMLDTAPQRVSDSLKVIEREGLSRSNKAYYDLLKVISDDKTFVNFSSDSLINVVSNFYNPEHQWKIPEKL